MDRTITRAKVMPGLLAAVGGLCLLATPAKAAPLPVTSLASDVPATVTQVQVPTKYYRTRPHQLLPGYGGGYSGWGTGYAYGGRPYGYGQTYTYARPYGYGRPYAYGSPYYGGRVYRRGINPGAAAAAGIFGLATGAILGSALNAAPNVGGSNWIAYCSRKYRSFDPASGTYLGYDGQRHACR